MKNYLKSIVAVALLFGTMTSMASTPKINLVPGTATKSVVLELDALSKDSKITLTNANAQTIYTEKVADGKYLRKFNLKNLENGNYYFNVENNEHSIIYTLNVKDSAVHISTDNTNKPVSVFKKVGEKVYLNLMNHDLKNVKIEIVDDLNRVVLRDSDKDKLLVERIYNFETAHEGRYTIKVIDGDRKYYETITIG